MRLFLLPYAVIKCFSSEVLHFRHRPASRGHVGIFLQAVEREFLSRKAARQGDAELLRHAVFDGGDQSQFLSHAYGKLAAELGEKRATRFSFCVESQPADYAHSEAARLREHSKTFFGSSQRAQ